MKTVAAKEGMMIREHDCEMLLLEPVEMKLTNERSVMRMRKVPILEFDRAPTKPRQRRSVIKFKKVGSTTMTGSKHVLVMPRGS